MQPTLSGGIYYLKAGEINNGSIQYISHNGVHLISGKFPNGSTSKTGAVPGMDFEYLTVPESQGTIKIEQFIQSTNRNQLNTNTTQYQHIYCTIYINPTTGAETRMPAGALDIGSAATVPWYQEPDDSPSSSSILVFREILTQVLKIT